LGTLWAMGRIILLLALAAGLAAAPLGSSANQTRLARYCSTTGDVCYGIFDENNAIRFKLTLAAKYFARYQICVRPLGQKTTCKTFRVTKKGVSFGGTVNWLRNFHTAGPRRYEVTWKQSGRRLGPTLKFTLPAPA
jgi:hypothetical protein